MKVVFFRVVNTSSLPILNRDFDYEHAENKCRWKQRLETQMSNAY